MNTWYGVIGSLCWHHWPGWCQNLWPKTNGINCQLKRRHRHISRIRIRCILLILWEQIWFAHQNHRMDEETFGLTETIISNSNFKTIVHWNQFIANQANSRKTLSTFSKWIRLWSQRDHLLSLGWTRFDLTSIRLLGFNIISQTLTASNLISQNCVSSK